MLDDIDELEYGDEFTIQNNEWIIGGCIISAPLRLTFDHCGKLDDVCYYEDVVFRKEGRVAKDGDRVPVCISDLMDEWCKLNKQRVDLEYSEAVGRKSEGVL